MGAQRVTRREVVAAGAAAGVGLVMPRSSAAAGTWTHTVDFGAMPAGDGWPGWACAGVANLHRSGSDGRLEAGSDVFPCDPRPVAFAVDKRFRDGEISAILTATGAGAGLVLRRVGPRDYYAAVLDDEEHALIVLRRSPDGVRELARTPLLPGPTPLRFSFSAHGAHPTIMRAAVDGVAGASVTAEDTTPSLQRAGDPGVLATARTLWPSQGPPPLQALGNLHLLPYGVQEGEVVMRTAVGQELLAAIRERSTAGFREISLHATGPPRPTAPSVVAATSGAPLIGGGLVRVATDVPATVEVEFALNRRFRRSRRVRAVRTDSFDAVIAGLHGLEPGRRLYWRARLRRRGHESVGPVRTLRVPPAAGSPERTTIAIGACASQFGPIFDELAARAPDIFIWQGDLNYADTNGPLAQTISGYAGIWRDFLANPRLSPILERTQFAAQRDDHDYGVQDANSTNLVPWGIAPWDALIGNRLHYRFSAGLADFWVLDQRRFKSDPTAPDTPGKTLLGDRQRNWLLRTLAASDAPFKIVCSPCTLAPLAANQRDGSWAAGFTAERDVILKHISEHVTGQTLFVTGDTHWTMVYDHDGLYEARPCPLGIPTPNDITLTQPQAAEDARRTPGVVYADDEKGHFALVEVSGSERLARVDLTLVREDGATPYARTFEQRRRT